MKYRPTFQLERAVEEHILDPMRNDEFQPNEFKSDLIKYLLRYYACNSGYDMSRLADIEARLSENMFESIRDLTKEVRQLKTDNRLLKEALEENAAAKESING